MGLELSLIPIVLSVPVSPTENPQPLNADVIRHTESDSGSDDVSLPPQVSLGCLVCVQVLGPASLISLALTSTLPGSL